MTFCTFPPLAIVKRNPLAATARRAGRIGCNFALDRIPADARIGIISTPRNADSSATVTASPEEVREKFRRIKPLKELGVTQRGWTLDVLNIVRRLKTGSSPDDVGARTFTNTDVYAHERKLAQLHPDNRHVKDKIRQQLQVLRDMGILSQPERGEWKIEG